VFLGRDAVPQRAVILLQPLLLRFTGELLSCSTCCALGFSLARPVLLRRGIRDGFLRATPPMPASPTLWAADVTACMRFRLAKKKAY
jgi:hypothetical protein